MSGSNAPDEPVTVIITRRVKAGREAAYEAWLQRLQNETRTVPGYLGVTTQRPAAGAPRDYVSVVRFASLAHLQAFERSDQRARHLAAVADLVETDAHWERVTGLEFWFTPPPGTVVAQPSRPRMALLLIAVVYLLVLGFGRLVALAAAALPVAPPLPVQLLVTITIEVVFMTWWLMPRLTRALSRWLYPPAAHQA